MFLSLCLLPVSGPLIDLELAMMRATFPGVLYQGDTFRAEETNMFSSDGSAIGDLPAEEIVLDTIGLNCELIYAGHLKQSTSGSDNHMVLPGLVWDYLLTKTLMTEAENQRIRGF